MDEIQALIPAFRAALMAELTTARQRNGAGAVEDYAVAVTRHRDRYIAKLKSICDLRDNFAISWMAEEAEKQIATIAAHEIERARHYGKIEVAP